MHQHNIEHVGPVARGGLCAAVSLMAAIVASSTATGQCYYTWTRIPQEAGTNVSGVAINNLGHVAGEIAGGGDTTRAFVWSPETGRVQLPLPAGFTSMGAYGINDLGHVAGTMSGPGVGWRGFVWDGQSYTMIDLPSWANVIEVSGVNDNDQVVGTVLNNQSGPLRPFVWEAGVMTELVEQSGSSSTRGRAINQRAELCGAAYGAQAIGHAWTASPDLELSWLPEPAGFVGTEAVALSNSGFVTGRARGVPVHFEGMVWTPWGMHVIPPGSNAHDAHINDVNDAGRAVGSYYGGGADSPIAWQQGLVTHLRPLITPPVSNLHHARAINRRGQIIALGNDTIVLNPVWVVGDLTGDCHVGIQDLMILLSDFGDPVGSFPLGDVDGDGRVGLSDLTLVLSSWGE